jgi:hypothetical protein
LAVEEHPDMATVAGSRTFQCRRHAVVMASVEVGEGVEHPGALVEVTGNEGASVTAQQRVDPDRHLASKVRRQHVVR